MHTRSPSFWLFFAFILLWFAQQFPIPGIFLMVLGAAVICGFLLLAFMVVVFIEVRLGLLPRWFALIPLVFFGGYYTLYFHQSWQIHNLESKLQKSNPSLIYRFNSDQEHLVTKYANSLVSGYQIPVVYEKKQDLRALIISYD